MLHEIPEYADVLTIKDFVEGVLNWSFIDYDGTGYYANPPLMDYQAKASPSVIRTGVVNDEAYTHVAWFNK